MAAGSSTPELFASIIGKKSRQPETQDLGRAQAWCPDKAFVSAWPQFSHL